MMKRLMLVLAGMGMLGAGLVQAQSNEPKLKVGDYAPDFEADEWINLMPGDEAPSLAELRGLVVVIFFWAGWHEGGEFMMSSVNLLDNNSRSGGVYTIGLTNGTRAQAEKLSQDAKAFFPIGSGSDAVKEYEFSGDFGFVVVDTAGKIAFRGSASEMGGLGQAINDTLNRNPPFKTHPREASKVRRLLESAREQMRAGDYRRAFDLGRDAFGRCVTGDPLMSQVFELFDLLEAIGYIRLDQVRPKLEDKDYAEAARLVRSVRRELTLLDAGRDAKRLNERLQEKSDGFLAAVEAHGLADDAAKLYYDARDLLQRHRYGECYDALNRILTEYPDTEAAPYASEMIDRMKAMPALWGHVLDHKAAPDCRNWLSQAKLKLRNRERTEARALLERIVREYPNTVYEAEARELLIDL